MDERENVRIRRAVRASIFFMVGVAVIMFNASLRPVPDVALPFLLKRGLPWCDSGSRVISARPTDRVAVLLPADKQFLDAHFREEGVPVPDGTSVIFLRDNDMKQLAFFYVGDSPHGAGKCVTEVIDVYHKGKSYTALEQKYFPQNPRATSVPAK